MTNLKLFILIACCFFFGDFSLNAQTAKFKGKIVSVQKARLPVNYTDADKRTYHLYTKGAYSGGIDAHGKKIYGWTKDTENPNVKAVVSLYGFSIGQAKRTSQAKEKKDKDGKVVDKWTEYTYSGTATGKGTLYIYGHNNPFTYKAKKKKKSKYELKQEEKAAAAKKDLEDNPFLSSEDVADAESDISEDSGLEGENLELIKTISIDQSKDVTTGAHRKSSSAYKEYTESQRPKLVSFKQGYPSAAYKRALSQLNYQYGYAPVKNTFYLKRMKTEKHKQFKMWNDAVQATQTLFKGFKYNKSIDDMQSKFEPIVGYFSDQLASIPDSDKKGKKMKKAAFQNLTNILYYLDRHDEVIAVANKNLEGKHTDKLAKRILANSERLKAHLAFHKMESCHFVTDEEVAEEDIETEESDDEEGN